MFQSKLIAYFEQWDRAPNHSPALPLTGPFKVRPFLSFRLREAFALAVCPYVDGWRGHQICPLPGLSPPRCWLFAAISAITELIIWSTEFQMLHDSFSFSAEVARNLR